MALEADSTELRIPPSVRRPRPASVGAGTPQVSSGCDCRQSALEADPTELRVPRVLAEAEAPLRRSSGPINDGDATVASRRSRPTPPSCAFHRPCARPRPRRLESRGPTQWGCDCRESALEADSTKLSTPPTVRRPRLRWRRSEGVLPRGTLFATRLPKCPPTHGGNPTHTCAPACLSFLRGNNFNVHDAFVMSGVTSFTREHGHA